MRSTLNKLEKNVDRAIHFMPRHGMSLINEIVGAFERKEIKEEFNINNVRDFINLQGWEISEVRKPDSFVEYRVRFFM